MKNRENIKDHCHINTDLDIDTFVGIKENTNDFKVFFPMGYHLSRLEKEVKIDIRILLNVLLKNTKKENRVLQENKFNSKVDVEFPINAYLFIIKYFLSHGYYIEKGNYYKTQKKGKINWLRTFKRQKPLVQQNGSFVYTRMTVRYNKPENNKLISQINKYCVYESFKELGWLFTSFSPRMPKIFFNKKLFIRILKKKLSNTYNTDQKILFIAMIDMINYLDERANNDQLYYGTNRFEYVWESLIDKTFGVKNKRDYFPRAEWTLRVGKKKKSSALLPDTIMKQGENFYVLDAKYYKYGVTGCYNDLPNSSSINKQITYGEYIDDIYCKGRGHRKVFNAFLMPYDKTENPFHLKNTFQNIGEATEKWKGRDDKNYSRVQGILVDTKDLMFHDKIGQKNYLKEFVKCIELNF